MQAAFAFELALVRFPRVRRGLAQEIRLVLEVLVLEVVLQLLVRRHARRDDAAQVRTVLGRLVHPRHVADGEIRIDADLARPAADVRHGERPQLGHVVDREREAQVDADAQLFHGPCDVVAADGEGVTVRRGAHGFVRGREDLARLLVLYVEEAPRVMRVVSLLRLHERLRLEVRRVRILGRFRLHELGGGVAAARHLDHHPAVPQEAAGVRHGGRAREFVAGAVLGRLQHGLSLSLLFALFIRCSVCGRPGRPGLPRAAWHSGYRSTSRRRRRRRMPPG